MALGGDRCGVGRDGGRLAAVAAEAVAPLDKIVLMPLSEYQSLLDQLEVLADIQAMLRAEAEYQAGQGRPFREFLTEYEDAFDLPG
ncbi:MAG TPA: hypothetical protein ENJ31_00020 [Anaerolineae bacterium]|nr:hypothetical protein [Anaerolineae bacterium]